MSLNISIPKRKYVCIANDLSNKELYASLSSGFKVGEVYEVEGSISGDYWYIFDKAGNYQASVKYEFLNLNFVPCKQKGVLPAPKKQMMDAFPIHEVQGKYVCIKDCETRTQLQYVMLPKIFVKGRTYNIKTIITSPLVRYVYEDGPSMEHYIGCIDKSFLKENFLPRNKEYVIYQELDNIFDEIFFK